MAAKEVKHTAVTATGKIVTRRSPRTYTHAILVDNRVGEARRLVALQEKLAALPAEDAEAELAEYKRHEAELEEHDRVSSALYGPSSDEAKRLAEQDAAKRAPNLKYTGWTFHTHMDASPYGLHTRHPETGTNARHAAMRATLHAVRSDLRREIAGLQESDGTGVLGWSQSEKNAVKAAAGFAKHVPGRIYVVEATRAA